MEGNGLKWQEAGSSEPNMPNPLDLNLPKFKLLLPTSKEKVLDVFRTMRKHGLPLGPEVERVLQADNN
jgi:hypothetical protein